MLAGAVEVGIDAGDEELGAVSTESAEAGRGPTADSCIGVKIGFSGFEQ